VNSGEPPMQESTRARREIQARLRSICARGGAVLSITAAVVALMMVGWGVGSAGAAADGDKPIKEIVVIAKRLTCEDGWACIDRKNPWFRMVMRGSQIPSTLFGPHKGLDVAVPTGTSVYAARSGVVAEVREKERQMPDKDDKSEEAQEIRNNATSTGNYIKIVYDDGDVGRYLHLKRNAVFVKRDQRVSAGDRIAESNETGNPIKGAHLHYDHQEGQKYLDHRKSSTIVNQNELAGS